MADRVHEQLNPSAFTRMLSVGRQVKRLRESVMNLQPRSKGAKLLGTTRVRITAVMSLSDGEILYTVIPAELQEGEVPSAQSAFVREVEFE